MLELTRPQKLIYNMEKFAGGSIATVCGSFIIKGSKDVSNLTNAVNELYRLNDAFRIRITETDSIPYQNITEYKLQEIGVLRFKDKAELNEYAEKFAREPMDLYGSLCNLEVVVLDDAYGILVKLHHIISDAWTHALICSQFNSILKGKSLETYSYVDYILAEQEYLNSNRYQKDRDYYIDQFKKCDETTYLSDKQINIYSSERKTFVVDREKTAKIVSFAKSNNISVFLLLMTVLGVYINRIKMNQERFYIGTAVLNRNGLAEKNTMGMFVNTVPVLFELENSSTFMENLERFSDKMMTMLRHQRFNYGDVLKELHNQSAFSSNLYDVMLSYQNAKVVEMEDDFESTWYHCGMQMESLQIHIDDRDSEGILKIHYDYQIEKFTEEEIEKMHEHIFNLLFDAVNEDKKISELNVLTEKEKNVLLNDFNDTKVDYPMDKSVYCLFEETAVKKPSDDCILTADKHMTFGELLTVSASLDSKIRSITNGVKSVIAVIAERSVEMYAAIYGIIRGGNAYLPISPDYPVDRINYILKDSDAKLVVTQKGFTHLVQDLPCIDMTDFLNDLPECTESLPCNAQPDDTAYVIYTSGSTGRPKGAKISHRSLINRILWMQDKYPLSDDSVILQKTPYTFDVSVWEIFWWGICGGSLAVSKPGEHFLPAKIIDEVFNSKVTHLHFVPSVFDLFLTYLEAHGEEKRKFATVKHILLSGEALNASLVKRFYNLFNYESVKLHNLYGPTECAIDVTYYDCTPEDIDPIPIGRPIFNTSMYVVDKFTNLLPYNAKGELCVGGVNVGQGYLNNSTLTAEKFIANPFGEGKLYKTGDIAYFRDDGQIIYCGRMDTQIKLNGQRVEISEIEVVISGIQGVDTVAVCVRSLNDRDTLVAFYCGEADENLIREKCEKSLPVYMIPTFIVKLEKMPLNPNGKLDKKALDAVNLVVDAERKREEPINETEKVICEKFAEILNNKDIDRNSNFFNCGGTSIAMISFLSDNRYDDLSASDFIANPTPAKLAEFMEKRNGNGFKTVKTLSEIPNSQGGVVLFPFAGGAEESFAELVNSFLNISQNYSLYYVDYLHNENECLQAAEELKQLSEKKKVYLYSHCAGSAVALKIIRILEKDGFENVVSGFISGANIPLENTSKKNIWNNLPDVVLKTVLLKAGAPFEKLGKDKVAKMLNSFRKDTDFYTEVFSSDGEKVKCKISCVISKKDLFTLNYRKAEKLWKKRTHNFGQVRFIDSRSHYFQSEQSDELARMLIELLEG